MYVHGASTSTPQTLRKTADEIRQDLEHLRRIEAQILVETVAKDKELARIRAARKRLEPKATYLPTAEALAYREAHSLAISQQPAPLHGGTTGLRKAAHEAATWDTTHRRGNAA